ncbi:XshC-Cox1-family protein [Streptomyces carminius]|uniref:XshC-Cox1-family protein n=1 Tax=Streptomyces carminius TaxID=2665496 RepID=A0A2M8LP76_9ACTN|nr:XdhC/CoxI family protein [Streptomyces carminius]PJE93763.1 XshC-Cox1-family protein [Streptomyces carminius]
MLDLAAELHRWCEQGRDFAVATVVAVGGSAPRQPGAALAVDSGGAALGSVSGGCVEGAVYELCRTALETGRPATERFGYADPAPDPEAPPGPVDGDPFAVGLTCGGTIGVLAVPVTVRFGRGADRATVAEALATAASGGTAALVRVVAGPGESPGELLGRPLLVRPDGTVSGGLGGGAELDRAAAAEARALLAAGRTAAVEVGTGAAGGRCGRPVTVLVESSAPPPRLLVYGAVDFAAALVRMGRFLGYRVTVCDARPVFATPARFPEADEVVADWPHRHLAAQAPDARTAVCVLTHDPKFDVPLLELALRRPAAYIGAMGSRRTHADRLARLRRAGLTEGELARLRSPIGLDLGARTPEETAVSIAAELVAARHGGSGAPLTGGALPIHHDSVPRGGAGPRPVRSARAAGGGATPPAPASASAP